MKVLSSKTNGQWVAVVPPLPPIPGAAQPAAPVPEDPAKAEGTRALSDVMRCSNLVVLAGLGGAGQPSPPPPLVQRLLDQYPDDIEYSDGSGLAVKPALIETFAVACEELLDVVFAKWLALEESRTGQSV